MSEARLVEALKDRVAEQISAVVREADAAIQAIEQETDAMVAEILKHQEATTEQRFHEFQQEAHAQFEAEHRHRRRTLLYQLVDAVFAEVDAELAALDQNPDYPEIWGRLYDEAREAYRKEDAGAPRVHLNPAHVPLAQAHGVAPEDMAPDADVKAGVILIHPQGRLRIINTPASRLSRGREEFVKQIASALGSGNVS